MKALIEETLAKIEDARGTLAEGRSKLGHYKSEQGGEDTTEFELNRWEAERVIVPRLDAVLSHLERVVGDLEWAREEWAKVPPPPPKKKVPEKDSE